MVETAETAKQVKPIWKCEVKDCGREFPPTLKGFRQIKAHQLKHANEGVPKGKRGYHLIDETTGEILAQKIEEATAKGFIATKPPEPTTPVLTPAMAIKQVEPEAKQVEPAKVEPIVLVPEVSQKVEPPKVEPPSDAPKTEEKAKAEITTVKTTGVFTYEITLPADAFTLFNLAKACGLEPNPGKLFDEWVWDCIRARYAKDYKKQLILAPVEE